MSVHNVELLYNGSFWETEPFECPGGDVRVRLHKEGLHPVELLVSIDGELEYLPYDILGDGERLCELTLEGVMPGQFIKFRSCCKLKLVRLLTI